MSEFIGYNDSPISSLDKDLFDMRQYVEGLRNFILECQTPMTISIQGDWGSGKTSMMNMIESELGKDILAIWFNTWQFSQFKLGNSLAISMLEVLLNKLDGDATALNKIADSTFGLLKDVALSFTEVTAGSKIANKIDGLISNYSEKSCVKEIAELKKNFEDAIEKKIKPPIKRVVVFVDDLDRLEPAKAIELLEVLKLFLDCKNCVFVLAVDYEVVTLGIRQKYGSDINASKGKSFFDKIIQLPFKMPVVQYNIKTYTESMMKKMHIQSDPPNVKLFSALIKTSVGLNPRAMKRLFNTYQLLYNIMPEDIQIHNFKQRILFAIVCMQMSFDAVYDYLSAGNVDIDTLNRLAEINDKTVRNFMKQRELSEATDTDTLDDNILNAIFDSKIPQEELLETLQKLPTFIKNFIAAISLDNSGKLSDKAIDYLQEILKQSAITAVKQGNQNGAVQQAVNLKQKNNLRAQLINKLLAERHVGNFKTLQDNRPANGIISKTSGGSCIYAHDDKKYQLRYVIEYIKDTTLTVSIYIIGQSQTSEEFYATLGDNPLEYDKMPTKTANRNSNGWYCYGDLLTANDNDNDFAERVANTIEAAYGRLKELLGGTLNEYILEN